MGDAHAPRRASGRAREQLSRESARPRSRARLRRGAETVGDLDLLVETDPTRPRRSAGCSRPSRTRAMTRRRARHARHVARQPRAPRGSAARHHDGAARTGSARYLVHFTGSAAHNVRLRQRAKQRGRSLSEHGLVPLDPASTPGAPSVPGARDLRERGGPLRAGSTSRRSSPSCARTGARSRPPPTAACRGLVTRADLVGDCHSHSDWSDGRTPLEQMVETARARWASSGSC